MKITIGILVVAFLAALTAGRAPGAQDKSLVLLHRNAGANQAKCVACHGQRKNELGSDKKTKSFHALHLTSRLLQLNCTDCHQRDDLQEGSGAAVCKQVSSATCAQCHSPWPAASAHTPQVKGLCATCHPNWKQRMAKSTRMVALNRVTAADCFGCHGGRALFVKQKVVR